MLKKSKIEKIMTIIPIALAFIVVGILVLGITGTLKLNRFTVDLMLILGVIAFGCISCLTAAKMISKDKKNIYAYIILGFTGLSCLLWIVFIFIGQGFIESLINDSGDASSLIGIWTYTKITIFITIQTSLINLVVSNIVTFKKEYFAFQIIMYVSNLIVDVWLSILILSISYNGNSVVFGANWLFNSKFVLTLFILAAAFSILASAIFKSIIKKRTRDLTLDKTNLFQTKEQVPATSIEERIKKLDELKEKGMISEEEYKEKKSKILEEI